MAARETALDPAISGAGCRAGSLILLSAMIAACTSACLPDALVAQVPARTVAGVIVDATTGRPLEGAVVSLFPSPAGLSRDAERELALVQRLSTGTDGRYAFADVTPGRYRLRIERIGFRAVTLDTEIRSPIDTRISVGMELEPLALQPVLVEDRAASPFRRVALGERPTDEARIALERQRQSLFLTPDSRIVTLADVHESVTLGENDVFRALQRFPGIATRDDYTAELWTRGAPWAQTRITFDDVPLFNPVHAVGVFSGVPTDAIGAVFLHTGVRSASMGAGAAGAVELQSRPGTGHGQVHGAADVSAASAKLTLEQRPGGAAAAWLLSARRSYLDLLDQSVDALGLEQLDLPYAFHDVTMRLDLPVGERAALASSVLWEEDRLFGDVDDVVERTNASWGNVAARITLSSPLAMLSVRHMIGISRYHAFIREAGDSLRDTRGLPWIEPETDNTLLHVRVAGDVEPVSAGSSPPAWSAGWELVAQNAFYDGPEPRFHPVRPDTMRRVTRDDRSTRVSAWAERRWTHGRISVQPGVRIEAGTAATNVGSVRLAPRLHAALALDENTSLSIAAGRTWQDLQALALAGPSAHPAFHAGQFWLQAGESAPALRADLVTAGVERWLGSRWLLGVSGWNRSESGVTLPDPRTGSLLRRPLFVTGTGRAQGIEASARRIAGTWTAGVAYGWARSHVRAAGLEYPASADRRHRVDVMAALRLRAGLRLGAAWTAMSGAPWTRVYGRAAGEDCDLLGFGCSQNVARIEAPNAERTPPYRSLDLMLVWTRTLGRLDLSAYLQVRNLLDRNNASTYSGTVPRVVRGRDGTAMLELTDRFEAGLPRMPLFGARVAF